MTVEIHAPGDLPGSLATFGRAHALLLTAVVAVAVGGSLAPAGASESRPSARDERPQVAQSREPISFDIAPQALSGAVTDFGRQSGFQVSVDHASLRDLTTRGVTGELEVEAALRRLLAGTPVTWRFSDDRTVVLTRVKDDASKLILEPITVEGQGETAWSPVEGYLATRSATGTRTDTPIIETPASIQVIGRDVIEDQSAQNLKDVYENVSGVYQAGNTLNAQSEVLPVIRGFESPVLYRNGMRSTTPGTVDLVNVERVEVLKGPASILYGALEPGGIVNYVTKRPLAEARYDFQQQGGSYRFLRSTADVGGPVLDDKSLLYRFNLGYTNADSFRDVIEVERLAVAPSLLWRPSSRTDLLLDLSYTKEEQPYDTGVPIGFDNEELVPDRTFFGDPDLAGRDIREYTGSYKLDHRFDNVFSLTHQFHAHRAHAKNESIRPRGLVGTTGAEVIRLRYQNEDRIADEVQMATDLKAKFGTGALDHHVVVGSELSYEEEDFRRFRQNIANVAVSANPNVDFTPPADQPQEVRIASSARASAYLQDQLSLLEGGRLKILLGGRFDAVETKSETDGVPEPVLQDSALTGRAGVLYRVFDPISVYASYSESFNPQDPGTNDASGVPLAPETGEQQEAGVKAELFDGGLVATASVFQIRKQDVAVFDNDLFNATGQSAFVPDVRQQSRGVELDVAGRIADGLSILGYYSYTDTEVLDNPQDSASIGDRLGNVPLHKARVWLKYRFAGNTPLAGLAVFGGARYVSENSAQFDTDVKLDPYTVVDLGAEYTWRSATLRLNLYNILDEEYFVRASDRSIVHPGEPFTALATLRVRF